MAKGFDEHGRLMIYFRGKHRPIKKEFEKLAKKDPIFLKLKAEMGVGNPSMTSIGIVCLMNDYVYRKKKEKEVKQSETNKNSN